MDILNRFFRGYRNRKYVPSYRGCATGMSYLNRFFRGYDNRKYVLLVLILIIFVADCSAGYAKSVPGFELSGSSSGAPAPAFTLEPLDPVALKARVKDKGAGSGSVTSVSLDELAGEVVLLHFWATWCAPCISELPALEALFKRFNKKNGRSEISIITVALDSRKKVRAYLKRHAIELPVYLDRYGKVMRSYGVSALPVTIVIGRDSKVLGRFTGPREWDSAEGRVFIEALLSKSVE